jgi:hypothetical protein
MDPVGIGIKQQDHFFELAPIQIELLGNSGIDGLNDPLKKAVALDFGQRRFPCIHRLSLHGQDQLALLVANTLDRRPSRFPFD